MAKDNADKAGLFGTKESCAIQRLRVLEELRTENEERFAALVRGTGSSPRDGYFGHQLKTKTGARSDEPRR